MASLLETGHSIKYRADVDGLRAVAVLGVVAYHTGLLRMSGGYVGVDVFFVISGYLISAIMFAEIDGGRFSLKGFYERRIRRIFPALFAMLAVVSVGATVALLPGELMDYSKSLLAATFSVSNLYFWNHSGYFDPQNSSPLLHTWSLAVEEQFYILFPLFLLLVRRFAPRRLRTAVVALFVVSFAASVLQVKLNPTTAFYMPYTRAWELLTGTMLSLGLFPSLRSAWSRNMASLLGAGMIVVAMFKYTPGTAFPGLAALPPCMGAALIIAAGQTGPSLVGRALALRPVVFVGLISYSLYLWHWPVIIANKMGLLFHMSPAVQGRLATVMPTDRFEHTVDVVLSLVLAVLSWWFVERPFRKGRLRVGGRPLFTAAAAVGLACALFSLVTLGERGFAGRFSPQALQVASFLDIRLDQRAMRYGTCFVENTQQLKGFDEKTCLTEDPQRKNYLLLGDSHAAALWKGLSTALPADNLMQANVAACKPFVGPQGGACGQMMDEIFKHYLPQNVVAGLLLEARWRPSDMAELGRTIAWLQARKVPVIVFGPAPEYESALPRLLAYQIAWNRPDLAAQSQVMNIAGLDAQMRRLSAEQWHVPYISLYRAICDAHGCIEYADPAKGIPMMHDSNHLNRYGSSFVAQRLLAQGNLR